MQKQGIDSDKVLLVKVLEEMDYTGALCNVVEKEKGNFSKMLSGTRKFPYNYIIAIEKILKTSIAYIVEGDEIDKKDFVNKGFEYAAYTNDYAQFVKLGKESDYSRSPIIFNVNEYGRCLLDYIIEYDAIEGIRYLYDEFQLHYASINDIFRTAKGILCTHNKNAYYYVAELLINHHENELFNKIFDSYELLFYYNDFSSLYVNEDFKKLILKNESVLDSILTYREIELSYANNHFRLNEETNKIMHFANPLINIIYKYAIENYQEYEKQVNKILEKGLKLNEAVLANLEKKYPILKDMAIDSSGLIISNNIHYTLIFNPQAKVDNLSKETTKLMNENERLINNYLLQNGKAITEENEERLLEYIYKCSGIRDNYRNNECVLNAIKDLLNESNISEKFRKRLSSKLSDYLNDKLTSLNKTSGDYISQYEEIKWSMIFIELFKEKLENL